MPSFHDVNFPLPLVFGASGGPVRQTEIITLANGHEQRNTAQANSRRRYDAGVGVKSLADMQMLIAFFEARRGQLCGFRFCDPMDHNADGEIGIGDGQTTEFQLSKTYADAAGSWQRTITKPKPGSVNIQLDAQPTSSFNLDISTGVVVFDTAPGSGVVIVANFEFDVPVRFDTEQLTTSLESFGAGGAVNVPLIEVLTNA
ncbi:MAG: DUF2460 domain-containing protein [Robiginitomaculum sp.]|nr:DUF2460 domain-containing protein [Robiginitomaculum sp.]